MLDDLLDGLVGVWTPNRKGKLMRREPLKPDTTHEPLTDEEKVSELEEEG